MPEEFQMTEELSELEDEIRKLPEDVQLWIKPCVMEIVRIMNNAGDAGPWALALVYRIVEAKINSLPPE